MSENGEKKDTLQTDMSNLAPILETLADAKKKLGNDAFQAKNYEEAIKFYSEAIKLDPENAIYYSNRSACYAFLQKWQQALEDAVLCISKDSKSVKGYYRLAQAQIELGQLEDAETTIIAALKLDPSNEPILKQRRLVASKRLAASKSGLIPKSLQNLDENQKKELIELQEQSNAYHRELRTVQAKLSALQRESRSCSVTTNYVQTMPPEAPLYRSVGKTFILTKRTDIEQRLETEMVNNTKSQRDLESQKEFLDRRITSTLQHMKEIATGN